MCIKVINFMLNFNFQQGVFWLWIITREGVFSTAEKGYMHGPAVLWHIVTVTTLYPGICVTFNILQFTVNPEEEIFHILYTSICKQVIISTTSIVKWLEAIVGVDASSICQPVHFSLGGSWSN